MFTLQTNCMPATLTVGPTSASSTYTAVNQTCLRLLLVQFEAEDKTMSSLWEQSAASQLDTAVWEQCSDAKTRTRLALQWAKAWGHEESLSRLENLTDEAPGSLGSLSEGETFKHLKGASQLASPPLPANRFYVMDRIDPAALFTPVLSDYGAELHWVAIPSQRAMSQLLFLRPPWRSQHRAADAVALTALSFKRCFFAIVSLASVFFFFFSSIG